MLDSIAKLMPVVTIAGGAAASSPQIKAQIEKITNTTKVVGVQTEVNNIAQMVYLEIINETMVKPEEFTTYLRKNMRMKNGIQRDTALDMWGTPYGLAYDTKANKLYVISAGPDLKYNSDDDIYASYQY